MDYDTVIGLEVHVQLKTGSKVFCGCSTAFGSPPNTQTCPVCLGFPGTLPVLNRDALKLAAKVALALNCRIANVIRFDRKNYFYPDLPKAYQISQFAQPLSEKGYLPIKTPDGDKKIAITRVHLEEDTGKLFHEQGSSLVDYNRSGVPLLEIVSEPDIASPEEAYAYLVSLKAILRYIGVSDCNMEEGSLRCDANISLKEKGSEVLGTKTEIKNMNSFKGVRAALEYEGIRQQDVIKAGGRITQETRLYDSSAGVTESMRSKEEAHDYRYFPEPDLVPFDFDEKFLAQAKEDLPELPEERKKRFIAQYGLSEYDASVMVSEKAFADYFEESLSFYGNAKTVANWLMGDIAAYAKEKGLTADSINLKSEYFAEMLKMIDDGSISGKIAKTVLAEMLDTGKPASAVVKEKGLEQISDEGRIGEVIDRVISENEKIVNDFKSGKENALMALVGRVMGKTRGKANPKKVNDLLRKKLAA